MAKIATIKTSSKTVQNIRSITESEDIFKEGIRKGLFEIGSDHIRTIRKLFKSPKHGKFYDGRRASAPGESLARLSGETERTLDYKVRGYTQVEIGFKTPYAKYWEEDAPENKKRTTLRDAVDQLEEETERNLLDYVQQEVDKRTK